jgi:hypothetical protein
MDYPNRTRPTSPKEANAIGPVVQVEGTLRADGTLVLDAKPNLAPGRVRVTVQPAESREDILEVLRRIRAEQAASGRVPRSREEIDADIAAMRQEDEERLQGIERLHEECRRAREQDRSPGES